MATEKETRIISAVKKAEPQKKRVNFFIAVEAKNALARWCKKHGLTESGAVEAMIRDTVPAQNFGDGK